MGRGGGEVPGGSRELDQTPTWAVAFVCSVIVLISIILEQLLQLLGKVLFGWLILLGWIGKDSMCFNLIY